MTLNFDNISIWPTYIKWGSIAACCSCIIFLWFLVDTRAQLNSVTTEPIQLSSYEKTIKNIQKNLSGLLQQLPEKSELPLLFEAISRQAKDVGLDVTLFKPLSEKQVGFYAELPIQMTVNGTYHQFAQFISQLSHLHSIVTVHDFTIEATNSDIVSSETLTMNMLLKTYRYTDQKPPQINPIPPFKKTKPVLYSAAHLRNPFSPTLVDTSESRHKEPLEFFPLSALKLVGFITTTGIPWAMISTPTNLTYPVSVGSYIGQQNGRVTAVTGKTIEVLEEGKQITINLNV
jgi:type IV pilus assembly protein PilO